MTHLLSETTYLRQSLLHSCVVRGKIGLLIDILIEHLPPPFQSLGRGRLDASGKDEGTLNAGGGDGQTSQDRVLPPRVSHRKFASLLSQEDAFGLTPLQRAHVFHGMDPGVPVSSHVLHALLVSQMMVYISANGIDSDTDSDNDSVRDSDYGSEANANVGRKVAHPNSIIQRHSGGGGTFGFVLSSNEEEAMVQVLICLLVPQLDHPREDVPSAGPPEMIPLVVAFCKVCIRVVCLLKGYFYVCLPYLSLPLLYQSSINTP